MFCGQKTYEVGDLEGRKMSPTQNGLVCPFHWQYLYERWFILMVPFGI